MTTKIGEEFLVNTTTYRGQANSSTATLADGRFVVAWTDDSADPVGGDDWGKAIKAQVFDTDGAPLGIEFLVNTTTAYDQDQPEVIALADGGFLVAWVDFGTSPQRAFRVQAFDDEGTRSGGEVTLIAPTRPAWWTQPAITQLADGRLAVTWIERHPDQPRNAVFIQLFETNGTESGPLLVTNDNRAASIYDPEIIALASGDFVVVWNEYLDPGKHSVTGRIFDMASGAIGEGQNFLQDQLFRHDEAAVAALPGGGFVIASRYLPSASVWDSALEVNVYDGYGNALFTFANRVPGLDVQQILQQPSVATFPDGSIVVSWHNQAEDASGGGVRAMLIDPAGRIAGADPVVIQEFPVNTSEYLRQDMPAVTALDGGRFVVTWTDHSATGGDTSGAAIRGQIFQAPAMQQNTAPVANDVVIIAGGSTGAEVNLGLSLCFTDPDGDHLTFTYTGLPNGITVHPSNSGFLVGTLEEPPGRYTTTVTAHDGRGGSASLTFEWDVTAPDPLYRPTELDMEKLARFVAYDPAATTYLPPGYVVGTSTSGPGLGQVIASDDHFQAAPIVSDSGEPILVLRGTSKALGDWINNADVNGVGYQELFDQWPQIRDWLQANPGAHIAGHSQGGAQAQLVAAWATQSGIEIGNVYTYNSPGISAAEAAKFNPHHAGDVLHYLSSGDVVQMVGDAFITGGVRMYDFDALSGDTTVLGPLKLFAEAHTGHWSAQDAFESAGSTAPFIAKADFEYIDGFISSDQLGAEDFSYLTAAGRFDAEYFALLVGLAQLQEPIAAATRSLLSRSGVDVRNLEIPHIAESLMTRSGAEALRKSAGMAILELDLNEIAQSLTKSVVEAVRQIPVSLAKLHFNPGAEFSKWSGAALAGFGSLSVDAIKSAASWTADAIIGLGELTSDAWAKTRGWTAETWRDIRHFSTDTWSALNGLGQSAFTSVVALGAAGFDKAQTAAGKTVDRVTDVVTGAGSAVTDAVWGAISATGQFIAGIGEKPSMQARTGAGAVTAANAAILVATDKGASLAGGSGSFYLPGQGQDSLTLRNGGNVVFGTADALDKDSIRGFGKDDQILFLDLTPKKGTFTLRKGSAIIEVDRDGDGRTDAVLRLEGDYDLASFVLTEQDGHTLIRYAPSVIRGGAGADRIAGAAKADLIHGLGGNDTLAGGAGDDTLYGGNGHDLLRGGVGHDRLFGDAGNDRLYGESGNDSLFGGAGNDTLYGGIGRDLLRGGAGNDTLFGDGGNDSLYGETGNDSLFGGAGNDTLYGGIGRDLLRGGAGNDTLFGDGGNDRLYGETGNDSLFGGAGNDTLYGGAGGDRLAGGKGADHLYGGAGADVFVFAALSDSTAQPAGRDVIHDFRRGQRDKVDLSQIDADATLRGKQSFDFIGDSAFSGAAGELRYEKRGGDSLILADVNGDGRADFSLLIRGLADPRETDFLL